MNSYAATMSVGVLLGTLSGQPVQAQTAPVKPAAAKPAKAEAKEPAPDPNAIQTVSIVEERSVNRADRDVYDVKPEASSGNNSAADTLNKIPAVSVDPDGNVTLRGKSDVQIYIDGKPAAQMQGENRAAALAAIPADDLKTVEVIHNPGAQFGNEAGGGAIINLVMRRERRAGGFAALSANAGNGGRHNANVNGSYNEGRYGYQGSLNVRNSPTHFTNQSDRRSLNPFSGLWNRNVSDGYGTNTDHNMGLNLSGRYHWGEKDTLGAGLTYSKSTLKSQANTHYQYLDQDDVLLEDYVNTRTNRGGHRTSYGYGVSLEHKGDREGELMKMDVRLTSRSDGADNLNDYVYTVRRPFSLDRTSHDNTGSSAKIFDYSGDYETPLDTGFLKLGYKLTNTQSESGVYTVNIDPVSGESTVVVQRTNSFKLNDSNAALYASYERPLNPQWALNLGLRSEYTHIDIDQLTSNLEASNHYINYIPSLFANYKASKTATVRFQYARRIQRASAQQLNPYVIYYNEQYISSGNPQLRPTQNDQFEIIYNAKQGAIDTTLRAFEKVEHDAIRSRRVFVSDTVQLSTYDNGGSKTEGGFEASLSGKMSPELTGRFSALVTRLVQPYVDINGAEAKAQRTGYSFKGSFNYKLSAEDMLFVFYTYQGKSVTNQGGVMEAVGTANLNFSHRISKELTLTASVQDLFDSNERRWVTDTPTQQATSMSKYGGRAFFVGLRYMFSGFQAAGDGQRMRPPGTEGRENGPFGGARPL